MGRARTLARFGKGDLFTREPETKTTAEYAKPARQKLTEIMNLIALALLIAFVVTLALSRLRRLHFRLSWIEGDIARTRSRSIRELALLATERTSHKDPYAGDWNC